MAPRCPAILIVLLLALPSAVPVLALPMDGPATPPALDPRDGPWWSTWASDSDRDGIHDWLEDLAAAALEEDPDARVDIVVDLDRAPVQRDLEGLERLGMEVQYVSRYVDAVLGSVPASSVEAFRGLPGVVMLEAQGRGYPLMASAGPSVALDVVHEDLGYTGKGVTVAVLDTGVNANHVALDDLDDLPQTDDPKLVVFYDAYANSTGSPYDGGEHGTWVAGISVGTDGGMSPNTGAAPGARLVGVRIGSPEGFPEYTALRGLEWTIDNKETYNISVMVCSWGILLGGPNDHNGRSAISRAADEAVAAGISVVVAAGNSALSATVTAPGDAFDVITVGSVDDDHHLSSFSSEGPTTDGRMKPDVCAPGESVTAAWSKSNTGYYTGDGTSASAPIVGGLIALMLEADPDLTTGNIKQILHETSEHNTARSIKYLLTPNNGYGWGVIHAPGAVSRAKDLRAPTIDIPVSVDSGEELDLTVTGSYARTQFTDLGANGEDRLGEDDVVLEATLPDSWGRPSRVTYQMGGDIFATVVPEPVSNDNGVWGLRVTFRVRTNVDGLTVGTPTITFTTTAPVTSEAKVYALTSQETLNDMTGTGGRVRVSVGGNVPPEIELTNPDGGGDNADTFFVIRWTDDDPDDNARISLYNDMDTDPTSGRVLIASNLAEDPEGDGDSYVWDTTTLVEGRSFYIQAVIDDGTNEPFSTYSAGTVTIRHTGGNAPPYVEVLEPNGEMDVADQSYTIEYLAHDPDDVASVSLYWDQDPSGFDGVAIVRDLEENDGPGTYTWDTSSLEDGANLWVYAVVNDGQNPQARAYSEGTVAIRHDYTPDVLTWSPMGQDVPLDEPVVVTFDRAMDEAATEAATSISPSRPGTFTWVDESMVFEPTGGWAADTLYTVTVSSGARDTEGNTMDSDHQWSFRTATGAPPVTVPSVTFALPMEGATVAGQVSVEGTSKGVGADGLVEVRIDGGGWLPATGTTTWSLLWDSSDVGDGRHTLSARGTNGDGEVGPVSMVNVTVLNTANTPPFVYPIGDRTATVGLELVVQVEAADPEEDVLTYSDDSDLLDIDPRTGVIRFTPRDDQVGEWSVTVTVSDGVHQTKATFIITVEPKEEAAGFHGIPIPTGTELVALTLLVILVVAAVAAARSRRAGNRDMRPGARS